MSGKSEVVTVHIMRKVKPGHSEALEEKVDAILNLAAGAEGYIGSGVLRGTLAGTSYLNVLLHFASRKHLDRWKESAEAGFLFEDAMEHVSAKPEVELAEGETGWFDLPSAPMAIVPPKWKMCIVSWLAIFPLLTIVLGGTAPFLQGLPLVARLFVNTLIIAPLMTWVVMPGMTHLFRRWLFVKGNGGS